MDYVEIILEVKGKFFRAQKSPSNLHQKDTHNRRIKTVAERCSGEPESTRKGYKFEVFFENLMSRHEKFTMVYKHPRSEIGEVDYVYRHELQDHPFWQISPYICVECKNWIGKISSTQVNHLCELIREKGPLCCCGVFITSSSYNPSALTAVRDSRLRDRIVIVLVERKHLKGLIKEGFKDFIQKLCEKIVFKK